MSEAERISARPMPARLRALAALVLALVPLVAAAQPEVPAAPRPLLPRHFLWAVSDDDNTVYLLGSFHLLRPEVYPLPAAIEAAYADAEALAFELDLDTLQAQASALVRRGMLPAGTTLADVVAPATAARLDSAAVALGLPAGVFAPVKPWLAAMTVTTLAVQRGGYRVAAGLDQHFFARARTDGKPRRALETLDAQLDALDGLPAADQDAFLQTTLDELDGAVATLDRLTAAWQEGDAAALEAEAFGQRDRYSAFYAGLLDARNRAWLPQVEALLTGSDDDALVVVGAGHLIGEAGLVALLRARGHVVEQR